MLFSQTAAGGFAADFGSPVRHPNQLTHPSAGVNQIRFKG